MPYLNVHAAPADVAGWGTGAPLPGPATIVSDMLGDQTEGGGAARPPGR